MQPTKLEVLSRFRQIQRRQMQEINLLEESVKKSLKNSTLISLKGDLTNAKAKIHLLGESLSEFDSRRSELLIRREIVDQLILLIDSRWDGKELQAFLEHSILDIALSDLTDNQGSGNSWKFMVYLSIAIREAPEPREDVLSVIESYMGFSSVLDPKNPVDFITSRNYSNRAESVSAHPVERGAIGDYVEKRTQEIAKARMQRTSQAKLTETLPLKQNSDSRPGSISGSTSSPTFSDANTPGFDSQSPIENKPNLPVKRPELELRLRNKLPEPSGTNESGTMYPAAPPAENEKFEQIYISPRLKAFNSDIIQSVNTSNVND